jgi:hypothetical protein
VRLSWAVAAGVLATLAVWAGDWVRGVLLAAGLVAAYAVLALVRPHKPCRRCEGTRRSHRWFGMWGPAGQCRKCRGRARHPRFAAGPVHRFARAAAGELADRFGGGR